MTQVKQAIERAEARAPFSYFEQLVCRKGDEIFTIEDHDLDLVTIAQSMIIARIPPGLSDDDQGELDFDADSEIEDEFEGWLAYDKAMNEEHIAMENIQW